jgi:DNA-binding SARP family transcriptional activator
MQGLMEFRALGPVELWSAGQQRDLGSARARAILAMLLLTPGTIVPADALIDRLWDTRPPPKARESLSAYIARLRASLRHGLDGSVQLLGRARGYMLDVDPDVIDLHQFRRLRRQANALAASGDFAHAAGLLREADGLWRGPALAGIAGDWVARMRDGLEDERRAAILERVECELELGRHADLVGELTPLLAQYPLDEAFVARQMMALYGSGRAAAALSLYRETRGRLIDEQGTEPGPMLTDLHQRILGVDPQLAARPADHRPADAPRPDTLPPELPEFVGRARELGLLTADRGAAPPVTVIEGMPGVGKTALAVQAARQLSGQYPDGALFLSLRSRQPEGQPLDPAEALDSLLAMLSVPAARIPESIGERAALWRAQLSRRRMIVILDDAARPDQIRPLLPAAGECLILITSRRRLSDVADARTLTLDVLPAADAVALFRQIAGADAAGDTGQVERAVQLCGHLPLAIQLTAGRVARDCPAGLAGLIEELSQAPARLGSGAASPEVTAAFDLSYNALEPDHQRLFRELGIGPGEYVSLQAAAALDGCTLAEAEKAVATLLDHHLLARAPDGQFRFHDLIRGYAAECAARTDPPAQQRQAISRLLDYYLHAADQADRVLHPFRRRMTVQVTQVPVAQPALRTPEDAAAWLGAEWRNILRAARHAGDHEWKRKCADLTHVLADFIQNQAHWDEAITAHAVALQAARDLADPARTAQAALELGAVRLQVGAHDAAVALAQEAATIYRSLGDQAGEAEALDQIGMVAHRATGPREALAYFQEALALYRAAASQRGIADTLSHSGISSWHLGRCAEAAARLREALSVYRDIGDRRGEAKTLNNLGKTYLYSGYHRDALDAYQGSLRIFQEIGGAPQNEAILYQAIGAVHHYKGSYEEGLAAYRQALAIFRAIGDLPDEADVLNDIGALYQSASCSDEALVYHQKAQLIAEEIGNSSQRLIAMRRIADIRRGSGQYGDAFDHYHSALRLAREIGDPYEEGKILEGIAESTVSTQRPSAARIFFRQALDIFERLGVPEAESARIRIETLDPAFAAAPPATAAG